MFDLEESISEWRRQMLSAGISTPVPLQELESHLREDVERKIRAGLAAPQAFEAAVQKIGRPEALQAEFAKTAELKELRERKQRLFCLVFCAFCYLWPLALSAPKPWINMNATERSLGLAAVALTIGAMFSGLLLHRFLPIIRDKKTRTRVQFASAIPLFIWLVVFTYVVLPRLELTIAQTTVAILWAVSPLAIFGGLIFGLDEAARKGKEKSVSS